MCRRWSWPKSVEQVVGLGGSSPGGAAVGVGVRAGSGAAGARIRADRDDDLIAVTPMVFLPPVRVIVMLAESRI